ncbi:hypothetical protein Salmuc_03125 [Salipiger mucosus DSM 16094]|uniref:Uncharacterized protein n=1 Tax=Salipiger mucosus DSM 16094 TaxID=1123237 RepID=S9Q891_9RHOB|nr:hypothetical protein Salmuc_03125 [Salipiger mucosus DSM 16094]
MVRHLGYPPPCHGSLDRTSNSRPANAKIVASGQPFVSLRSCPCPASLR